MPKQINSADEVIEALGGTGAVARLFGVDDRVVSNWRRADRGLPPYTFVTLTKALASEGYVAPQALWRMWEPAAS